MSENHHQEGNKRKEYNFTYALAAVAGQVGCVTIIIVLGSLLAGLWLDRQFDTSPLFLISLLLLTAPVTIVIMLWIVKSVTSRMKTTTQQETGDSQEEANRGTKE